MKKYNLSKIMKRAWALVKEAKMTISSALKEAWMEAKNMVEEIKNVVIKHFCSFNARRYSSPWVCVMTNDGTYDFSKKVGKYTGEFGDEGDLLIFAPVIGQVYAWGQKDRRGSYTEKNFCIWTGKELAACDKFGNLI